MDTRYSPVRRSPSQVASNPHAAPRLACVKPVASVHPEPGSNSTLYNSFNQIVPYKGRAAHSSSARTPRCSFACVSLSKNFRSPQGQALKSGCKSTHFTLNRKILPQENRKTNSVLTFVHKHGCLTHYYIINTAWQRRGKRRRRRAGRTAAERAKKGRHATHG